MKEDNSERLFEDLAHLLTQDDDEDYIGELRARALRAAVKLSPQDAARLMCALSVREVYDRATSERLGEEARPGEEVPLVFMIYNKSVDVIKALCEKAEGMP